MTTHTEANYWMRQATEAKATIRHAKRAQRGDILEDIAWGATLIFWWLAWITVCAWKTVPGGLEALPMFLILAGMGTIIGITAWVKTR